MATPPESLRLLLAGAVDYAGLFPPASLSLPETLVRYGTYLHWPQSWALGRLVLPAHRLGDLRKILDPHPADRRWEVSVLIGADVEADVRGARELGAAAPRFGVAALEGAAAAAPEAVAAFAGRIAASAGDLGVPVYAEIPLDEPLAPALDVVAAHGLRAKARTGGVIAEAIPESGRVVGFMRACDERGLSYKLTAGLHHALRGSHALTYQPESACATMHGFLNAFVAGALLAAGAPAASVEAAFQETDAAAFGFDADGLTWRGQRAGLDAVRRSRERLVSFGSCSFQEPIQELQALGLA